MQDLKTAHHEYTTELNALTARLERAEGRAKDSEAGLNMAQQKAHMVSLLPTTMWLFLSSEG